MQNDIVKPPKPSDKQETSKQPAAAVVPTVPNTSVPDSTQLPSSDTATQAPSPEKSDQPGEATVSQSAKPKSGGNSAVGPIIIAVIVFLALAGAAVYMQL